MRRLVALVAGAAVAREVIVVPVGPRVGGADAACLEQRVEALAASAGDRDVVVLAADPGALRRWRDTSRVVAQPLDALRNGTWSSFGGARSGASKPAFIRWFADSRYDAAWHVEDDAFFTGKWAALLDGADPAADLVAADLVEHASSGKGWNAAAVRACAIDGRPCGTRGVLVQTAWPVVRLSRRLGLALANGLDAGTIRGGHEAVAHAACARASFQDCVVAKIDAALVGAVVLGGTRVAPPPGKTFARRPKSREYTLAFAASLELVDGARRGINAVGNGTAESNRLYHPVKCAADAGLGAEALAYARGAAAPRRERGGAGPPPAFATLTAERWCAIANRSSLFDAACGHVALRRPPAPLLVTGAGSAGTLYVAEWLRRSGMRVSHDDRDRCPCPGRDGAVSWPHAFAATPECPGPAWSFGRRGRSRFRGVAHLVRDTLSTIASRYRRLAGGEAGRWHAHAACHTSLPPVAPDASKDTLLALAAEHVVLWSLFVESHAAERVKVEAVAADAARIGLGLCERHVRRAGVDCPPAAHFDAAAATLGDAVNAHGRGAANESGVRARALPHAILKPRRKRRSARGGLGSLFRGGGRRPPPRPPAPRRRLAAADAVTWDRLERADARVAALARNLAARYGYDAGGAVADRRPPECRLDANGRWTCALRG